MKKFIIFCFILFIVFLISCCKPIEQDTFESANDFYKNINAGFNLGMSFSAYDNSPYEADSKEKVTKYELMWCDTLTDKELFSVLKEKGFNLIRITISLKNHLNSQGIIDQLWIDRIKEVVTDIISLDIHCILCLSEDVGICTKNLSTYKFKREESTKLFSSIWNQLANSFKDYNQLLLFESFNELRNENGDWYTSKRKELNNVNILYQIFIETIRKSGGNNRCRNLVLSTYASSINEHMLSRIRLPKDKAKGHLLFDVHCYDPINFTFNEINLGSTDFIDTWGSQSDYDNLNNTISSIKNNLASKYHIPVIIGEFGCVRRAPIEERTRYIRAYCNDCIANGLKYIIFDDAHDFLIINRSTKEFIDEDIVDIIVNKKQ